MNRKEFIKVMGAAAGAAAFGNIGCAEEETKKMSKSIIIYFSHTGENYSVGNITVGNTAKVAKEIAAQTGAPTWEIKETDEYSKTSYNDCVSRAKKEKQQNARPAFVGEAPDLSQYDTIFLGYPNWWADAPMVVYTFLDKAKIDGKTILPFCTHEGSGLGSTARSLAKAYPKAKVELKGLALYGHVAQKEPDAVKSAVAKWLKDRGISK